MRLIIAVGLALISGAAGAEEISEKAYSCWSVPAGFENGPPPISFDVKIGAGGRVEDVSKVGDKASDARARQYEEASSRAIERCAPYDGIAPGTHRVTLDLAESLKQE